MLNVNEVWQRVVQLPQFQGQRITDYLLQAWGLTQQLTTGATLDNIPLTFATGAIIVGMTGGARPDSQAATQQYGPGNDLYRISISDQSSTRKIVGTSKLLGTAVFGPFNDLFPAREIIVPPNQSLIFGFTNQTTSTINIDIVAHLLVPNRIS